MKIPCLRKSGPLLLATLSLAASVQAGSNNSVPNNNYVPEVEWVEAAVPPAPAFQPANGLAVEMPPHVSVKVAVDPSTVFIGTDGVVRYVAYMVNQSGTVSALYEGIRCPTGEVKTYARWNPSNGWTPVSEPVWKEMNSNLPSKHAYSIARQGACEVRLPRSSVVEVLGALKRGAPLR